MKLRLTFFLLILLLSTLPSFAQEQVTHIIQPGENLFRIALRYDVTMDELAATNQIADARHIYAGQELIIPGLALPVEEVVENPLVAAAPVVYTVQRGDILDNIATRYGVTVDQIMQGNNISNPNRILPGQELNIWPSDPSLLDGGENTEGTVVVEENAVAEENIVPEEIATHVVQSGEHLAQIAQQYGVSWTIIAQVNNIINPDQLFAGTTLTIPISGTISDAVSFANNEGITQLIANQPSPRVGTGREIVVVLSTQMVYAYEDGNLQKSALVSTGLPGTPTVQGDYKIWHKTDAQTMSGPGYYLENVQWVMYFFEGYGFHGTYWHNNYGQPMSHGCVNMTNDDALWLYSFASVGTPVHVRYY